MKIAHLLTWSVLTMVTSLTLASCNDNSPEPDIPSAYVPQNLEFKLGMKGYAAEPQIVGRFGVAKSIGDAREGNGTELRGVVQWTETQGGKLAKSIVLPNQKSGTTRWVYLSTPVKPKGNQSISLNWAVTESLVLNATSADTIVFREFTIP